MSTQVRDVSSPELFLADFPEDGVPLVRIEGDKASRLPREAWVTETTHRDGQQGGIPFTTDQAVRAFELIDRASGGGRAIRQAEFFVYARSDKEAFLRCQALYREGRARVEPTTWVRASTNDVKLLRDLGVRETGLLASASDYHTFFKFKPGGRARAAAAYLDAVRLALDAGIRPRVHLEDATRAPLDFLLPFARAVEEAAEPYGPSLAPRFRICDTLGVGLPFEEAPLPRSIPRLVRAVIERAGVPGERLEIHPHNDTGLVVANALAAVLAGCAAVNGCLLGKGERTGNAPLEVVLFHLMGLYPDLSPELSAVNELVRFYEEIGEPVAPKHPLFGRDAHLTRAGIHADALRKDRRTYTFCDTERVLGRPLEVLLTKESGLGGLAFLILQKTGRDVPKDDERLRATWAALEGSFQGGRTVAYGWEELRSSVFPRTFPDLALQRA
ncbi:pyruvate carboxyltransferase [bacterium]|nr:pyruvate carboxyltransferase [bacterium]